MVGPTEEEILTNGVDVFMKEMLKNRNYDGVKKALELGADVNIPHNIYLYTATSDYDFDIRILELLLEADIDFDAEILLRLYEGKNFDAIKLVEKHYGIEFESEMKKEKPTDYLKYGLLKNDIEIIKEAIKVGASIWSIHLWIAINRQCSYEIVHFLMFMGVEFDDDFYYVFRRGKQKSPEYYTDELLNLIKDYEKTINFKNEIKKV